MGRRFSGYGSVFAGALLSLSSVGERQVYANDATSSPRTEDLSEKVRDKQKTNCKSVDDDNVREHGDYRPQEDLDELARGISSLPEFRELPEADKYRADGLVGNPGDLNAQLGNGVFGIARTREGLYLVDLGKTYRKDNYKEKEDVREVEIVARIEYVNNRDGIKHRKGLNLYPGGCRLTLKPKGPIGIHVHKEDVIYSFTVEGKKEENKTPEKR